MKGRRASDEGGFTLVELLIVTVLIPIIVGSMAFAIQAAFSVQSSVTNRVNGAGEAQVAGTMYYQDVQGALTVTMSASVSQCGSGTQVLGLGWSPSSQTPGTYNDIVSYVDESSGSSQILVRNFCSDGYSVTPTSSTTIAVIPTSEVAAATIAPNSEAEDASSAWVSTQDVTDIGLVINGEGSDATFTLVAAPAAGASGGDAT